MTDLLVGCLLFVAIVIGWLLGKAERRRKPVKIQQNPVNREYFHGLNLLLNERQDEALEVFLRTLEVNSDTIETYLVLGSLFRRRGEVERSIRIHQDLLARPSLDRPKQARVRFELAKDYLKAGLLDRAERIFKEIVAEDALQATESLELLLSVYEQEKEWGQAIEIGQRLLAKGRSEVAGRIAHFHCESAKQAMQQGDLIESRRQVRRALQADKQCVRASLVLADIEMKAQEPVEAIKALKKVCQQDPDYLPETLELLQRCHEEIDKLDEFVDYLFECLKQYPGISLVLYLSERVRELKGDAEGAYVLLEYLKKRPSLRGLHRLIQYQIHKSSGEGKENLLVLQSFTEQLIQSKPVYRCGVCGFEGKKLHWCCPSCKNWGTVKPIQGLEGE